MYFRELFDPSLTQNCVNVLVRTIFASIFGPGISSFSKKSKVSFLKLNYHAVTVAKVTFTSPINQYKYYVVYLRQSLTNIYRVTVLNRRRMVSLFLQWKGHDTHKMFNKTSFPANLGLFFRPIFRSVFLMKYINTSTLPTFSYQPAK